MHIFYNMYSFYFKCFLLFILKVKFDRSINVILVVQLVNLKFNRKGSSINYNNFFKVKLII
jgi:hypothetical protein